MAIQGRVRAAAVVAVGALRNDALELEPLDAVVEFAAVDVEVFAVLWMALPSLSGDTTN
jgi:hypothetical protein